MIVLGSLGVQEAFFFILHLCSPYRFISTELAFSQVQPCKAFLSCMLFKADQCDEFTSILQVPGHVLKLGKEKGDTTTSIFLYWMA